MHARTHLPVRNAPGRVTATQASPTVASGHAPAVRALLHPEPRTVTQRLAFRAWIPRARDDSAPAQEAGGPDPAAVAARAAPEGERAGTEAPAPAPSAQEGAPEGTRRAPVRLPDIVVPELAALDRCDDVTATFTYNGSIARGGAGPSGFGVTRSFSSSLSNIDVDSSWWSGYEVTATLDHPITYQVRSGTGPDGQVDIASATDGDITAANYGTVVSDLTPNTSDLNGRPPRTQFWCEDLTLRHERVHADDDHGNAPAALRTVTTWLNGQTANSIIGVAILLGKVPGRFATELLNALSTVDGEKHAYGEGAAAYTARANAIKTKGDAGGYP